jgi:formylglycine-generating enzyme required for sulfatase activity
MERCFISFVSLIFALNVTFNQTGHAAEADGRGKGLHARHAVRAPWWTNSLGMQFVPVGPTKVLFCVWKTRVQHFQAIVSDTGYDATEGMATLRADRWKCRGDTWRSPGFSQGPTHPVCGVSWTDASAFCEWLTRKERAAGRFSEKQRYRLPTDEEWSVAVGDSKYPWGNAWPPSATAGNYAGDEAVDENWPTDFTTIEGYRDKYARTSPVGSFAANRYGLYDLGGNLWEWCEDWYRKEMNSEEMRKAHPYLNNDGGGKSLYPLRGASWHTHVSDSLCSSHRYMHHPDNRDDTIGFRVVLTAEDSPQVVNADGDGVVKAP